MNKNFLTVFFATLLFVSCSGKEPTIAVSNNQKFSSEVASIILETHPFMDEKKFNQHLKNIDQALSFPEITPYEKSIIFKMQGAAYFELEKYDESIISFENAIKTGVLSEEELKQTKSHIIYVHFANHVPRERDVCFQEIKMAYDAVMILGSKFSFESEVCQKYKSEYDINFRFNDVTESELCFQRIKAAYDADVTWFRLDDRKCLQYLPEFERRYRTKVTLP